MIQNVRTFIKIWTSLLCQYGVNQYIHGPVFIVLFSCDSTYINSAGREAYVQVGCVYKIPTEQQAVYTQTRCCMACTDNIIVLAHDQFSLRVHVIYYHLVFLFVFKLLN